MTKKQDAAAEATVDFEEGDDLMVDLNNIDDSEFAVLPMGMYPVTVSDCEFAFSNSGGNPMWSLTLDVNDGEYAGRKLFSHLVWAGKGLPFTKKAILRIAPELFDAPFDPRDQSVVETMLGKQLRAKVVVKMYEGEETNNVRGLFADEGGNDSFV